MPEAASSPLSAWESFYVILGSSAAVLTGLVFVVITLIPEDQSRRSTGALETGIAAFNTSTIVHYCAVLFVSAVLSAPWHELLNATLLLCLAGLAGIAYVLITLRRLRRQDGYDPVLEDWLFYALIPLAAYAALAIIALFLPNYPRRALFGIATASLLLLFLGLHNTWDTLTFMALQRLQRRSQRGE